MLVACRSFILFAAVAVLSTSNAAAADEPPKWQLPPGFTIEQVAGPPLVQHPTMGCFDDRGRLYICDGPGDNLYAKDLLAQLPHSIKRLEDTDGDGKFDHVVTFADKMVFPMGACWHDGAIYTASPPHIWRLRDTDDDGVADERKILVSEFGFTGNAADIHGCFLGPDGRIYWCDGRHGHTFTDEQGNTISKGLAARLFSCKPDGSDVQVFAGGGMDNPVEVDFTEEGEPIGTVAIYDNVPDRVDALIHWVYGGVYPRSDQKCLEEFKRTGDLLPAVRRYGRVAPAGITRFRGSAWGADYRDNFFHVQFNTHRMIRTKLTREGASFRGDDEEFLVSENQDVHLTDVIEDPSGSLLVVDTGGWFRIACPNSQIAKPEILGGIYRIRKTDAMKIKDPYGLKLAWEYAPTSELIERLGGAEPQVIGRTIATLSKTGHSDSSGLSTQDTLRRATKESDDPTIRRNAIWALTRIGSVSAYHALGEAAANDEDAGVRIAALHGIGSINIQDETERLLILIHAEHRIRTKQEQDPTVIREYASTVARIKPYGMDGSLFAALKDSTNDRMQEHALLYALIQLNINELKRRSENNPKRAIFENLTPYLTHADPILRRGALIALDQSGDSRLTLDVVAKLLDVEDARLQRTAIEVLRRHADWVDGVLGYLKRRLQPAVVADDEAELLRDTILAYKTDERVQQIVAAALADAKLDPSQRRLLLEVIERSEFDAKTLPPAWAERLTAQLQLADDAVVRQAVSAATRVGSERFAEPLLAIARDDARPDDLRIAALNALGDRLPPLDARIYLYLTTRLTTAADPLDRAAAAKVLGIAPLDVEQRTLLLDAVRKAGPMELPALLPAFAKIDTAAEGLRFIDALAASPGLENVASSNLEKLLAPFPPEARTAAEPLFKRINADIEVQRARLTELATQLDGGDAKNGATVFQMVKTACSSCHRVGPRGMAVGPDLTQVGRIRSRLDLLEAIIYPSASFVRDYESLAVETSDGRVVIGLPTRQTPEAIYLRTPQKEEIRVARSEIETIAPGKLSIMPQGLDKIMTPAELRDLIAYLQTLK